MTAIRGGVDKAIAARAAGIQLVTFYRWLSKGKRGIQSKKYGPIYEDFYKAVKQAEALAEVYLLGKVQQSIEKGDVGSAKWILERRFRQRWGANAQGNTPLDGQGGQGEVEFVLAVPPPPSATNDFGDQKKLPAQVDVEAEDVEIFPEETDDTEAGERKPEQES